MLVSVWGQMIGGRGAAAGALIVPSQEVQAGPSYEASYVGDKLKSSGWSNCQAGTELVCAFDSGELIDSGILGA